MFWRKKKEIEDERDAKEAQIKAIHEETLKKIDQTAKSVKRLNKLLDDPTYRIFLATGGDKRERP